MTCAGCGGGLPEGARFCPACGLPVASGCRSCAADLPPGARFCPSCGTDQRPVATPEPYAAGPAPVDDGPEPPVVASVARRVTSVLFGDLVGFTTLSEGRDQEDVRELLSGYFETSRRIVERYGGVVEKFIGDAVMAVWGVPVAHEDDAERAVRAGVELVAAVAALGEEVGVPGLAMRVGIVTGEVAVNVGAVGQGMVAGDPVNTAARVQAAAAPGQVWVDEPTRSLTDRAITFSDTGTHALKGKSEPVRLWAVRAVVAGIGGSQRSDGLEAPMVGRDRELRMLKEAFHRTGETGSPSLVVLSGEAGVGKSRLVWEFEKYADGLAETTMWHTGRCVAYGEGVAFYALAEAIRARVRLTVAAAEGEGVAATDPEGAADAALHLLRATGGPTPGEDMAGLLEQALAVLVPEVTERDWLAPRVAALLGVGSIAEFTREDVFAAWTTFLRRVADGASSLVWVVDDAEHADEGLVAFVEHLLSSKVPVLVVMVTRPSLLGAHPGLVHHPGALLVSLAPLPDDDIARLLDGLVRGLPDELRAGLAARSEGVPLFAVETVRSLVDRGYVSPVDGVHVLAEAELDLDAIGAPASLQAVLAARLDALSEEERLVVDTASVLGLSFHRDHLGAMLAASGGEVGSLDPVLDRLARAQILTRETSRWSGDFGRWRFVQAVLPQVAYGMLARRHRRIRHLEAATVMEAEPDAGAELAPVIATHLIRAIEAVPDDDTEGLRERAVGHLVRAAERAEGLSAIREAAAHLAAAEELTEDPLARARLALRRGQLLGMVDVGACIATLEPLVAVFDAAGDVVAAGTAAGMLAIQLVLIARLDEARALAEPRWAALKDRTDADVAVVELATAMHAITYAGAAVPSDRYAVAVLAVAARRGDQGLTMRGLSSLAINYSIRGIAIVEHVLLQEVLRRAEEVSPHQRAIVLGNLAAGRLAHDADGALEHARQAASLVDEFGLVMQIAYLNLAHAALAAGHWDEVLAAVAQGPPTSGVPTVETASLALDAVVVAAARGETPPTRPALADAPQSSYVEALVLAADAVRDVCWGSRRDLTALAAPLHRLRVMTGLGDDLTVVWWGVMEIAAMAGPDTEGLSDLLAVIAHDEEDRSVPAAIRGHQHRGHALLARRRGDHDAAVAALEGALTAYAECHWRVAEARVRAELAGLLAGTGDLSDRDRAREMVAQARATYAGIGASAWLAELEPAERALRQEVGA